MLRLYRDWVKFFGKGPDDGGGGGGGGGGVCGGGFYRL